MFSYIPRPLLTNPAYYESPSSDLSEKAYGMDGKLSYYHKDLDYNNEVDGSDVVYLYAGMRRGGISYYALNITDPENPTIAWQIHGPYQDTNKNVPTVTTGFSKLGQTWSKMIPAQVNWDGSRRVVLFFTGVMTRIKTTRPHAPTTMSAMPFIWWTQKPASCCGKPL